MEWTLLDSNIGLHFLQETLQQGRQFPLEGVFRHGLGLSRDAGGADRSIAPPSTELLITSEYPCTACENVTEVCELPWKGIPIGAASQFAMVESFASMFRVLMARNPPLNVGCSGNFEGVLSFLCLPGEFDIYGAGMS